MNSVITNEKKIASNLNEFKKKIASLQNESKEILWAFPNGEKATCNTSILKTSLGDLYIADPGVWNNRQPFLIALATKETVPSPDVEINIPDSLDRRVSGVYVDLGEDTLLCHRGGFTAYRGKIPKEICLNYFEKWLINVDDDGKEADLISITSLNSNTFANDIAEFVSEVSEMKAKFKSEIELKKLIPQQTAGEMETNSKALKRSLKRNPAQRTMNICTAPFVMRLRES